jgi:hydrogenase nickel incorporation protein HypA/HybF
MAIVENAARHEQAQRITRVRLSVGALAHVDADTLAYCCGVVSRGGLAESAEFLVERRPGRAWCEPCARDVELPRIGEPCPHCGGFALRVTDGDQLQVLEVGIK